MKQLLFAALLASTGCGRVIPAQTWEIVGCSDSDVASIHRSAYSWNEAIASRGLSTTATLTFGESYQKVVCVYSDSEQVAKQMAARNFAGWTVNQYVYALRTPTHPISNHQFQAIVVHEFGHVIGLDHSTDTKAVMWPNNDSSSPIEPTSTDVDALESIVN